VGARRGGAHPPQTPRGARPRCALCCAPLHTHTPQPFRRTCFPLTRTRRFQEAGFDPDISNGLRRLADPDDPEAQLQQAQQAQGAAAGAAAHMATLGVTAGGDDDDDTRPAPPRYGAVLREVTAVSEAAPAATAASANKHSAAAGDAPAVSEVSPPPPPPPPAVREVLRRVFPRDHPGVGAMCSWLDEEGVRDAAQLRELLTPAHAHAASRSKGGAAALRELGFRPEWADAVAAGFARAAAAAEKADAATQ
jgi:hypothetical protein